MPYGNLLADVVQGSVANTPPVFRDGNGTQVGTLCRAWVNFNGTGTVAIRASFNVSSITDNGSGNYTVNFTNAMPDANYSAMGSAGTTSALDFNQQYWVYQRDTETRTASLVRMVVVQHGPAAGWIPLPSDVSQVNIAIFR